MIPLQSKRFIPLLNPIETINVFITLICIKHDKNITRTAQRKTKQNNKLYLALRMQLAHCPPPSYFRFVLFVFLLESQLGFSLVNSRVGPVLKYKNIPDCLLLICITKIAYNVSVYSFLLLHAVIN